MKTRHLTLMALTLVAISLTGTAYASNETMGGNPQDGRDGWSQHKECHHEKLSDEKRDLLRTTMHAAFEKNKGLFDQMHKLHKQLHTILKADAFDQKAFVSTSLQIEKTHDRIHEIRAEAFASIASQFTPEERMRIVHFLNHHHRHGHHGKGKKHQENRDHASMDNGLPPPGMEDGHNSPQQDQQAYPPYPSR